MSGGDVLVTRAKTIPFPHIRYWTPREQRAVEYLKDGRHYSPESIAQACGLEIETVHEIMCWLNKPP